VFGWEGEAHLQRDRNAAEGRTDSLQSNGASAPPAGQQEDRRVPEQEAAGGSQGGILPCTGVAANAAQEEMAQDTARDEGMAASPLKTGTRKRTVAER
jgi:hypothetical protein